MAALWDTVIQNPTSLHVFVETLPEAMRLFPKNDYYQDDTELLRSISNLRDVQKHPPGLVAAMKLAVHQMSFSGLGTCRRTDDQPALSLQRRYPVLKDLHLQ